MKYNIIACLLLLWSCTGNAQTQKTVVNSVETKITDKKEKIEEPTLPQPEFLPFEFEDATSQKFSGGAPGSNIIYMYQVKLKKTTDKSLAFKALWTKPKSPSLDFQLKRKFQADDWANYKNEDQLMLYAQKTEYGEAAKAAMKKYNKEVKQGKQAPYVFESAGLIEYELDGITYYYEVENIVSLPSVAAP